MSQSYPYAQNPLFNHSKYLTCFIQDGKIYTWSAEGTQQIGVSNQVFNELQTQYDGVYEVTTQYKERLIQLGEIAPELTQEEIIKQQAEQLRQTQQALAVSLERLEALTGGMKHESVETVQRGSDSGNGPVKDKESATESKRADDGAEVHGVEKPHPKRPK